MFKKAKSLIGDFLKIIRPQDDTTHLLEICNRSTFCKEFEEKADCLRDLINWVSLPVSVEDPENKTEFYQKINLRISFFLKRLESETEWHKSFSDIFHTIVFRTSFRQLFAETGLAQESGFLTELTNRLSQKVTPASLELSDITLIFQHSFQKSIDPEWIENISEQNAAGILKLITNQKKSEEFGLLDHLHKEIYDALILLGLRIAALGTNRDIQSRLATKVPLQKSPFIALNDSIKEIDLKSGFEQIDECRFLIKEVYFHLETGGVSVKLVHQLETLESSLNRTELLMQLLWKQKEEYVSSLAVKLVADLIRQTHETSTVSGFIKRRIHLLARKLSERTGETGEHYISRNPQEYLAMIRSAAGGGFLTVGTTLFKFMISGLHMAPFFQGFFSWINYSGSFIAMQLWKFTLATKQPSMTAPFLAGQLNNIKTKEDKELFVAEIARVVRSQFAAALGNLFCVIIGSVAVDRIYFILFGSHIISSSYSFEIIESLDPRFSLSLPMAAYTGVLLWLSSLAAVLFENWIAFNKVPEKLKKHRKLRSVLGDKRAESLSQWILKQSAGFAGNLSLGMFLAFTPVFGKFFGLALEARHVTLSTGALSFAISSVGWHSLTTGTIVALVIGIILIGILNFGISFAFALVVAIRSQKIHLEFELKIFSRIFRQFLKTPLIFFLPIDKTKKTTKKT